MRIHDQLKKETVIIDRAKRMFLTVLEDKRAKRNMEWSEYKLKNMKKYRWNLNKDKYKRGIT